MTRNVVEKGVLNSMTTESACLAGRNNIEKWMSYEIIVMRIALSCDDNKRVVMADGIPTNLNNCNYKNELQWDTKYFSW